MIGETKWSVDQAYSEITFKVKHLMIANVSGSFKTFDATIYTAGENFESAEINLWIEAASISTGNAKRDEHLKSHDFFDVQNHHRILFIASTIEKADANGKQRITGDLTIKGITKKITLNVLFGGMITDTEGNEKAGFSIFGKINRSDWQLHWNTPLESGGFLISDEIHIACEFELINSSKKNLTRVLNYSTETNRYNATQ